METVRPRAPWQAVAPLLAALFYGASPIDLVPDLLPLLGWLDDGVIGGLLLALAAVSFFRHSRARRQLARVPARE